MAWGDRDAGAGELPTYRSTLAPSGEFSAMLKTRQALVEEIAVAAPSLTGRRPAALSLNDGYAS